jgi:hypothetical protein
LSARSLWVSLVLAAAAVACTGERCGDEPPSPPAAQPASQMGSSPASIALRRGVISVANTDGGATGDN